MDNAQMKPDKENEFLLHFYETIIARIKSDKRTTWVREGGRGRIRHFHCHFAYIKHINITHRSQPINDVVCSSRGLQCTPHVLHKICLILRMQFSKLTTFITTIIICSLSCCSLFTLQIWTFCTETLCSYTFPIHVQSQEIRNAM